VESEGVGRYPPEVEAAVYFCCLEALQNATKHAGEGARATVRLLRRSDELSFSVADDGVGFDAAAGPSESFGLQNMSDRIGALGGELSVESSPGRGTRVVGAVPLILTPLADR
jgi:signal transduction histidine kinase